MEEWLALQAAGNQGARGDAVKPKLATAKGPARPARRYNPDIVPTEDEIRRLLKCTRGSGWPGCRRYYVLFVLLANAGLRISEALHLVAENLDRARQTLRVHTLKRRRRRPAAKQKGWRRDVHEMQLHPQVATLVKGYIARRRLAPAERLFPMTRESAWEAFQRYAKLAGLPAGYSLHSLRHFAGTREYQATGDLRWVQHRLRHRALSSTAHYAKVTAAQEAAEVQKIGAVT